MQQAGGRMEIDSTPNVGTTVSLWLPVVQVDTSNDRVDDALALGTEHVVLLMMMNCWFVNRFDCCWKNWDGMWRLAPIEQRLKMYWRVV